MHTASNIALALAATRADTPELRAERFCSDGFHLVCPPKHPLLKAPVVRPGDIGAWPFIHLSRTSSVRQVIDAATYPRALRSVLEVDQLATVAGMVRAGLGISVVPALALYQFKGPGLRTRPIDWPGLRRHIYVVRRRDRSLSIAAETLHAFMHARAPEAQASAVFDAVCNIKPCLLPSGVVAKPRHALGHVCVLRLASRPNPSVLLSCTQHRILH